MFPEIGDRLIHVGEVAHIIPVMPTGPRGASAASDATDRPENLILLCPTCHATVDKAPETYTVHTLRQWKEGHLLRIRRAFGARQYSSRSEARHAINSLLAQNYQIHLHYGPEAPGASEPESEMPRAWHRKIREIILPNSQQIIQVLDLNRHLLAEDEREAAERFRGHVDDLTARHVLGLKEPNRLRFPEEINQILT